MIFFGKVEVKYDQIQAQGPSLPQDSRRILITQQAKHMLYFGKTKGPRTSKQIKVDEIDGSGFKCMKMDENEQKLIKMDESE